MKNKNNLNKTQQVLKAIKEKDVEALKILWKEISDKIPREFNTKNSNDDFRDYLKKEIDMYDLLYIEYTNLDFDCIFRNDHKASLYTTSKGGIQIYICNDDTRTCECSNFDKYGRYDFILLICSYTGMNQIEVLEFLKEVFDVKCYLETITDKVLDSFYDTSSFYFY